MAKQGRTGSLMRTGTRRRAAWAARDIPGRWARKAKGARQRAGGRQSRSSPTASSATPCRPARSRSASHAAAARRGPDRPRATGTRTSRSRWSRRMPGGDPTACTSPGTGTRSALIEIEGRRVLLDPVWSDRCSPSRLAGPKRLHEPPVAAARAAPAGRRADLPRPLRPPRHGDHPEPGGPAGRAVPGAARRRRAPGALGRAGRPGSSSWTGTSATSVAGLEFIATAGPALLRPGLLPRRDPVGVLGHRRPDPQGVLLRRHRLLRRLRRRSARSTARST